MPGKRDRTQTEKYNAFRAKEERYRANVLAAANLAAKHNKKRKRPNPSDKEKGKYKMGSYYGTYYGPWTERQQNNIEEKIRKLENGLFAAYGEEIEETKQEIARLKHKAAIFRAKLKKTTPEIVWNKSTHTYSYTKERVQEIQKAKQVAKKLIMLQNKRGFGGAPIVQRTDQPQENPTDIQEADDDVQDVTAEIKKAKAKDIEWVSLLSDDDDDNVINSDEERYKAGISSKWSRKRKKWN